MRTTLAIDDELIAEAEALVGRMSKSALVHEALVALVQRENARRLALLGGSDPDLPDVPRRKSPTA
ncbi:MAG: type II toxin-antitoxin system VapB family antitoxin [Pseudomonadota bacterium]|nr:type II toxin-antitoxin system VapB family antitoxin [Pseudomonadota bacterium]